MRRSCSRHRGGSSVVEAARPHQMTDKSKFLTIKTRHVSELSTREAVKSHERCHTVIGPLTEAFPANEGWYAEGQKPRKNVRRARADAGGNSESEDEGGTEGDPRTLSDLTIGAMTRIFTRRITEGVRPNCEANWVIAWQRAFGAPMPFQPKWDEIWRSFGTPLSDPSEEKAWRKLLHRAWNAKNRHPKELDKACRHKCGVASESMIHMLTCMHVELLVA